jgi:lipopolysaccharide/colanic/teichoic acid biosynthesis glycosyltransferase
VFALAACCIKLTSPGPVFYRQLRIGRNGRPFQMLKFRSMVISAESIGSRITVSGDRRVTAIGRFLRRYKIDELPQLWNVFRGDMSLVGPRPELPTYVSSYTREQLRVLLVRPGVTDPASLAYRWEEEILANSDDPEEFYNAHVLPDKLAKNLAYLGTISLAGDLRLICETITLVFTPSRQESHLKKPNPDLRPE